MLGHYELVQLLVKAGADVNMLDNDCHIPLYTAASYGRQDIFEYLYPLTNSDADRASLRKLLIHQLENT